MAKESVIVFDGEDKFIAKKDKQYDKSTGFSNYVGAGGETLQSPPTETAMPTTADGALFNQYIASQNTSLDVPVSSDPDFCSKAQEFLSNNGGGRATPEQVMQVYNEFQRVCVRPAEDDNSFVEPNWATLSCDEIGAKITELENTLATSRMVEKLRAKYETAVANGKSAQTEKCGVNPPALPDVPPAPTPTPTPIVSLTNLGVAPQSGAAAGGGGAEKEEKKRSNLWIWLVVGAGLLYLLSKDKN